MTSVFTEIMQQLTDFSAKIDNNTFTNDDFVELQRLHDRIAKARDEGRIKNNAYQAFVKLYYIIHSDARYILGLY